MTTYPTYKLGDILSYEQPTNYIVESTEYDDSYPTPVLTAGKSFILGYTNETKGVYDKLPVIIFDDFTTASQFVDFKFKVKSSAMKILSCNEEIADIKYMYYLMQITHIQSDTHKRYWISDYSKIPVSLPPLPTQQAIVTRIESLFAELDKAAEHLRTAQQQLKTYRQAVLNHWLNNDEGKWEMVKLGEVLQKIEAGKSFRCNEKVPALHEKGIVKISAVTWGEFLEDECKTIINEDLYNPQFAIHKGDLLISRANTIQLVGNCVLVRKEPKRNIMLSDKVLRLVISDNADSDFILYSLRTSKSRTQIQNMSTGNQDSMRNIGQDRIKKIEIPLPPLTEQQRIVKEIESRLSQASASSACIENALQQAEALRQSILKKAFSGELV